MLRLPVKIILVVVGALAIVLGLHSVWVFVNTPSLVSLFAGIFGGSGMDITEKSLLALQGSPYASYARLFMVIDLPLKIQYPVVMASVLGIKSWLGGVFLIGFGIGMLYLNQQIYYRGSGLLRRWHLW